MADGGTEIIGGIAVETEISFAGFDADEQKLKARAQALESATKIRIGAYGGSSTGSSSGTFAVAPQPANPWQVVGQNYNGGRFTSNPTNQIVGPWQAAGTSLSSTAEGASGSPVISSLFPNLGGSSAQITSPEPVWVQTATTQAITTAATAATVPVAGNPTALSGQSTYATASSPQAIAQAATAATIAASNSSNSGSQPSGLSPQGVVQQAATAAAQSAIASVAGPTNFQAATPMNAAASKAMLQSQGVNAIGTGAGGVQGIAQAHQPLIAALNHLASVVGGSQVHGRPGASPGPSGGTRSGGGGSGSGGGRSPMSRNLFSARGLGPYVGGVTAAFAAIEAIKVAGEFQQASQIEQHPERLLAKLQTFENPHDVRDDSFLQGQTAQQAALMANQKRRSAIEGIPLIGSIATVFGADDDAANQREQERIEKNVAGHQRIVAMGDQQRIKGWEFARDPVRAKAEQYQQQISSMDRYIKENPNDTQAVDVRHQTIQFAKNELARMREEQTSQTVTAQATGNAAQAAGEQDSTRAIQIKQADSRRALRFEADFAIQHAHPNDAPMVANRYAVQERAQDQEQGAERVANERKIQAEIVSVKAEGQAEGLRAGHENAQAEMAIFEASAKNQIANADVRTRPTIVAAVNAERQARQQQIQEQTDNSNEMNRATTQGYQLRGLRLPFQAQLLESFTADRQRIEQMPGAERNSATEALQARVKTEIAEHRREVADQNNALVASTEADKMRQKDRPIEAGVIEATASAEQAVRASNPETRRAIISAQLERLNEMKHEIVGVRGGATAIDATATEIVGDPLDLSGEARDRKGAINRIDKERRHLEQERDSAAKDASGPGGGDAGKANQLLEEISKAATQLVKLYDATAHAG